MGPSEARNQDSERNRIWGILFLFVCLFVSMFDLGREDFRARQSHLFDLFFS